jgi:hypothetical protein
MNGLIEKRKSEINQWRSVTEGPTLISHDPYRNQRSSEMIKL